MRGIRRGKLHRKDLPPKKGPNIQQQQTCVSFQRKKKGDEKKKTVPGDTKGVGKFECTGIRKMWSKKE